MSKRTLTAEQKAKMQAGAAKARAAKKNQTTATRHAVLAGAAKGRLLAADGTEPLRITRVTDTKVFAGSREFLKATGYEERQDGVEVQAALLARPVAPEKVAPKTKGGKKNAAGAKDDATPAKRMGQLDAAAKVLATPGGPADMNCQDLVKAMEASGLWKSPGGKTPHATLHAAISKEINNKGAESRFRKAGRGLFALAT
jgi:hypothetical protein